MHYLYLLEPESDQRYYIGQTNDLTRRLIEHNRKNCLYTSGKGPWKLVGFRPFSSRGEAVPEEKRLKNARNKKYIYFYFKNIARDIPTQSGRQGFSIPWFIN
jgi:putative endonuclease